MRDDNFFINTVNIGCRSKKYEAKNIRRYGNTKFWCADIYLNGELQFNQSYEPNGLRTKVLKSPLDLIDKNIYKVYGYRWGDKNAHNYLHEQFDTLKSAIASAENEAIERGGKYSFVVYKRNNAVYITEVPEHYKLGKNRQELKLGIKI